MKKMLLIGMLSLLATMGLGVTAADAYDKHHGNQQDSSYSQNSQQNQLREDARFVLRRTATVLQRVQDAAREQRNQRNQWGNNHHRQQEMGQRNSFRALGMAFAYQNRAVEFYQQGNYKLAIDYSLRSRAIALRMYDQMSQGNQRGQSWNNVRNNDQDYQNCDMNRNELDSRESRYWDRHPHGNEMAINWHETNDDDIIRFHIELNF